MMRSKCQETGFEQKIPEKEIIARLLLGTYFEKNPSCIYKILKFIDIFYGHKFALNTLFLTLTGGHNGDWNLKKSN